MRRSQFPYAVDIAAPARGQQVMYDFHARHGIRAQPGQGKYKDGRRYLRWRFASLTMLRSLLANLVGRCLRDDRVRRLMTTLT